MCLRMCACRVGGRLHTVVVELRGVERLVELQMAHRVVERDGVLVLLGLVLVDDLVGVRVRVRVKAGVRVRVRVE